MRDIEVKPLESKKKSFLFSWFSGLRETIGKYIEELTYSLEIFRRGHVYLASYVLIAVGLFYYIFSNLLAYSYQVIDSLEEKLHLSKRAVNLSKEGFYILCCILFLPIAISLLIFPVRIIWMHGKIVFSELLKGTFLSIQLSLRSTFLSIRASLPHLAPFIAICFIYFTFREKILGNHIYQLGLSFAFVLGLVSIYKAVPILVSPIIAISGQYRAEVAIQLCYQIADKRKGYITSLIIITSILSGLVHLLFKLSFLSFASSLAIELSIIFILLWYTFVALTLKIIESIVEFQNANQARNQPANLVQAPPVPQAPVYISVENLWVKK